VTVLSQRAREDALRGALASERSMADLLDDVEVPVDIATWLGRLHALAGVPFGYLVPDEAMLPPESIRFFHVDAAWAEALVDGAFSVGRNLTSDDSAPSLALDRALRPAVLASARAAAPRRVNPAAVPPADRGPRPDGARPEPGEPVTWTGFLLRSRVVAEYPGLGVNAYPDGATGDDPAQRLPIVRLERLGPSADTLTCIVDGEAAFFDIHEPPEHVHFGVQDYAPPATVPGVPEATKALRPFRQDKDGAVTLSQDPAPPPTPVGAAFRARSPRVMNVAAMARLVASNVGHSVDAAQLGFEMTQGVGSARFARSPARNRP